MKFPKVLDKQLQEELLKEYIETKDNDIRETLILHNLRLVKAVIKQYMKANDPLREEEDLFNEGVIGLMNSLESYEPDKGTWYNHAATHIKATVRAYIRDRAKGVRVPAGVYEALYKVETFKREYIRKHNGEEPTTREISRALEIPYKKVVALLRINQNTTSLDIDISEDGEGTSLMEILEDPEADFEGDLVSSVFIDEFLAKTKEILDEDEFEALRLTLGLNCREHQLMEVAEIINRSTYYTREIRDKALRKVMRSKYGKQLRKELDEVTIWYKSPSYEMQGISGGNPDSAVERIVLQRERYYEYLRKELGLK